MKKFSWTKFVIAAGFLAPLEFLEQPHAKSGEEQPDDNIIQWAKPRNECQCGNGFYNHCGNLPANYRMSSETLMIFWRILKGGIIQRHILLFDWIRFLVFLFLFLLEALIILILPRFFFPTFSHISSPCSLRFS